MPRNSTGKYFLPSGNPVSSGELITAEWANSTLSDIASAMSDSLDREGLGGMNAPLPLADGTQSKPGWNFTNESNTGMYRPSDRTVAMVVGGLNIFQVTTEGVQLKPSKVLMLPESPSAATDAANKAYVDNAKQAAETYAQNQAQDAKDYALGLIPSGTRMLFQQTSAPSGWTKDTTHNNKALRVVSGGAGSGGSIEFSTAFANRNVSDTALNTDQIPGHTHGFSATTSTAGNHDHGVNDPGHRHTQQASSNSTNATQYTAVDGVGSDKGQGRTEYAKTGVSIRNAGNHTHSVSGTTSSTGSGRAHSHTLDMDVAYVDVIIGVKD